ncbi:MAG: dihydropteroate synthase-like protein [Promethearchaeota archaeon]
MLRPSDVANLVKKEEAWSPEVVLLPGLVAWSAARVEREVGLPVRKGPRNFADLPALLGSFRLDDLSHDVAADRVMTKDVERNWTEFLDRLREDQASFTGTRNFLLGKSENAVPVGRDFPPVVVAQVLDATTSDWSQVRDEVEHFLAQGARVVDLGATAAESHPDRLATLVNRVKEQFDVPVAVDSMRKEEVLAGVDAGADLVLSADLGNFNDVVDRLPRDVAVVAIPTNQAKGKFQRGVDDRVDNLVGLVSRLLDAGFRKVLADPLLESPVQPGCLRSLAAYHAFRERSPHDVPLLMGTENVTEMCDFDSPGVNGLLAALAVECGAGALLTTEASNKTRGCVGELVRAVKLASVARWKRAPPKDFPFHALVCKSKKGADPLADLDAILAENGPRNVKFFEITAASDPSYEEDPMGYFKFHVDHHAGLLVALHYDADHRLAGVARGATAEALCKALLRAGWVSSAEHAAYVGRELARAEAALRCKATYIQED